MAVVALFLARPAAHHARATTLLMAFSDAKAKPEVVEELLTIDVPASPAGPARTVKARMFSPPGGTPKDVPAVVLVHGVQYLGIEEPRLQRFAKSVVSAGIVVLTPQVDELADYARLGALDRDRRRVDPGAAGAHGRRIAGRAHGDELRRRRLAAHGRRPALRRRGRVRRRDRRARRSRRACRASSRTTRSRRSTGTTKKLRAHGYGATVLVYTHAEDFFPPEDVPAARDALRSWLREKRDAARESAKVARPRVEGEDGHRSSDRTSARCARRSSAMIEQRATDMRPSHRTTASAALKAHVYLLHGAGDTVIPATETMWLAKDVPPTSLRTVLVSPAIEHVELKEPSIADQWALVHFMSDVIGEAEAAR